MIPRPTTIKRISEHSETLKLLCKLMMNASANGRRRSRRDSASSNSTTDTAGTDVDTCDYDANEFLEANPEKHELEQRWYSRESISLYISVIMDALWTLPADARIAFICTPSLYFTIPERTRSRCFLFDIDERWSSDRGFVLYNYIKPIDIDASFAKSFDMVVIDPPCSISSEDWEKVARTATYLLKFNPIWYGSKSLVLTTTESKHSLSMIRLLGVRQKEYKPSFATATPVNVNEKEYDTYTNFRSAVLSSAA
mmetsp:Transcript_27346/g.42464  ORF Transcript_27346/g.42464 Transcript_27346/m.42464 type:complete len:254 (-) Transcript_27346:43-804(-)